MRKYTAKMRPRTLLYTMFLVIELFAIGSFIGAAVAGYQAVYTNYAATAQVGTLVYAPGS